MAIVDPPVRACDTRMLERTPQVADKLQCMLVFQVPAKSRNSESWQNGYCTGLENRRPKGLGGSSPSLSAI